MKRKFHVRFGERDGEDRTEQSVYGVPVPTLRDPTPSPDDVAVTREVVLAGKLLDIEVLDHLIIGRGCFVSLKERGLGFDGRVSETRPDYRLRSARSSIQEDDDLIYAYTRSQALADGVLVDVSQMASEAGFRYPTAITTDLHARTTPNERERALGQSYEGRLWDVVFLASFAARQSGTQDRCSFEVSLFEADEDSTATHPLPHALVVDGSRPWRSG